MQLLSSQILLLSSRLQLLSSLIQLRVQSGTATFAATFESDMQLRLTAALSNTSELPVVN